jgi:hypothetical protein
MGNFFYAVILTQAQKVHKKNITGRQWRDDWKKKIGKRR